MLGRADHERKALRAKGHAHKIAVAIREFDKEPQWIVAQGGQVIEQIARRSGPGTEGIPR